MQNTMFLKRIAFGLQKLLLSASYQFFRNIRWFRPKQTITWVVGVIEVAAMVKYISAALDNAYSVSFLKNPYYEFEYNFSIVPGRIEVLNNLRIFLMGPILLGYLVNHAHNFLYIWSTGFLIADIDQREFEFKFIKSKNKKIVCYFVGNDIRAPRLLLKFAEENQLEVAANYYSVSTPHRLTDSYDLEKRRIAQVAQNHASLIFNAAVDQMAYLTTKTTPFIYFFPDEHFVKNNAKFRNPSIVTIVHAPSTPVVKGTQLVRAAIAKLRAEGYVFEYIELTDVSNVKVLKALRSAHIVLNEFYAFVPGVFGIEAMASHCALITSADEKIERDLPPGANEAWLVTRNYQIYDNLKALIDSPARMKAYADSGYAWALKHTSIKNAGHKISKLLNNLT